MGSLERSRGVKMISDFKGKNLRVYIDYEEKTVPALSYIKAKTVALRNFGYTNLTEETVMKQILAILNKEKLDVIGLFMEGEVLWIEE